jgi:protein-S-isoprenylcysteine O-methyltransferase Ste14
MDEKNQQETLGMPLILKSFSIFIVFIAVTFITAGRLDYWQGWMFNGLNIFFLLITYLVLKDRKDLIKERLQPGKGMKRWDRVYYVVSTPIFFAMLILSALDAGRFHWNPTVPFLIIIIGIIMYSIGQIIVLWAKKTNIFFSSVVRIQSERKQTVCSDGPYRYVRHPGYVGGFIFTIATPLVLGSFWGLLPAGITIILMIGRTYLEDTTLKAELKGYKDYAKQVHYRLIPFLW